MKINEFVLISGGIGMIISGLIIHSESSLSVGLGLIILAVSVLK